MPKRINITTLKKRDSLYFDSDWLHQTAVGSLVEHICIEAYGVDKATKEAESILSDVPESHLRIIMAEVFRNNSTTKFDGNQPYIDYISIKEAVDAYKVFRRGVIGSNIKPPISDEEFGDILRMIIANIKKLDGLLVELPHIIAAIRFRTTLHDMIKEVDDE